MGGVLKWVGTYSICGCGCVCVCVCLPNCNIQEELCLYCLVSKSTIIQFAFEIMNISCINNFCIKFIPDFYMGSCIFFIFVLLVVLISVCVCVC